ncbi:hypothetical protein V1525DRAFT_439053, partial [Lipomyces kononenkoae]
RNQSIRRLSPVNASQLPCARSRHDCALEIVELCHYPSLTYNSVAEIVTVITVPRDLHEIAASDLVNSIVESAGTYLARHGADVSLIERITDVGAPDRKGRGEYARSKKMADRTIVYTAVEGGKTMTASEVGFTESYLALCQDKDFWILGQHVDVCVLDVDAEVATMMQKVAADFDMESAHGHYSSIEYRGHKWTGELREAFIEVWRGNSTRPTRYTLIQNSWSLTRPPKTLGLTIRELVPQKYLTDVHVPDADIGFDEDKYLRRLRYFMREAAREKYFDFISP